MSAAEPAIATVAEQFATTREIARRYFAGRPADLDTDDKGSRTGFDPVTAADREIETVLRAAISRDWPDDRIVGEEEGVSGAADAARSWYLDPIDGTKAFLTGMTGWGTLVGVVEDGRAVAGWMDQPVLGETFAAVDGRATVTRSCPTGAAGGVVEDLQTSGCTRLDEAIMYTTHPSMFDGAPAAPYAALAARVRLQRFGGDCYAYCQLAAGRIDLVVESELNSHDIVALIPIVEAAGGVVWGPDGTQPLDGGTVVAAATPELARAAWDILAADGPTTP